VHVSAETLQGWTAEGGVSRVTAERLLCDAGIVPVHMGRRVLRAETGAFAALATVNALAGDAS